MGDRNLSCRPRHLVLAVLSKIKVMCHSCIFIGIIMEGMVIYMACMRGVYVLIKHSSSDWFCEDSVNPVP